MWIYYIIKKSVGRVASLLGECDILRGKKNKDFGPVAIKRDTGAIWADIAPCLESHCPYTAGKKS